MREIWGLRLRRNQITKKQLTAWEITVAKAAPRTPNLSRKMNTGSSSTFRIAPMITVAMPMVE